ncbi:MAG: bifunctional diaminohydroxyphosphoribosylaminopyrimidine deaminase/5-amino-6-(5-phosphoribosylamino)uracil reductase RibD [Synergistaceae bacterium]|jgi:diaminohydroxyphosphoribosylaminopyrimidine deaminase/5-amino-6-(5-phosphoribosylamino)uracil reductase|nr:bifunctional diaminohydroxyphosphoribosylaminopyrimidine deaminase/5-amino-6-(5-phosphoribosylamino)uracil reductase RibD [Synergistaceae bacterium]
MYFNSKWPVAKTGGAGKIMTAKNVMDEYYMRRALSLAWRGLDEARPNPMVGCVLVKGSGQVVGEGWHARCGGSHAEIAALTDAARRGEDVRGATAYVTLEPCSHFGKTPPCAPRLVEEGIARVVAGSADPNPKVAGRGFEILRSAGVQVTTSCLEVECKRLNRGFFRRHTLNRPWITLKAATGLDGRMALPSGESKWITGETARTWAHLLRAGHDGILVGAGTVLADDPELTVRHTCGKSPLRVILDGGLSIPSTARVLKGGCLVLTAEGGGEGQEALERVGVEVCRLPGKDGRVDLSAALKELARRGVQSLMVEGGPRTLSAFMGAGLCDGLALFTAASVMGEGPGLGSGLRFDFMGEALRLRETRARRAGNDLLVEGVFECSPAL